jgi:hypothetical protein
VWAYANAVAAIRISSVSTVSPFISPSVATIDATGSYFAAPGGLATSPVQLAVQIDHSHKGLSRFPPRAALW